MRIGRIAGIALAAASLVVGFGLSTIPAAASSGAGNHFTANYQYNAGTFWTCSGTHVANNNVFKDNETCLVTGNTTGFVAGTYTTGMALPPFGVGWSSDYPPEAGALAISYTITETNNGNGTWTVSITAFYSS
jgi:hypothetical protein